jgi:hypothetical protein
VTVSISKTVSPVSVKVPVPKPDRNWTPIWTTWVGS